MTTELTVILETNELTLQKAVTELVVASSGPQGPRGPQGLPGASGGTVYLHTQSVASSTWTINHNIGRPVVVTLFDEFGEVVFTDITHGTTNTATVTWSSPAIGSAIVL